ncbi:hypothetical protein JCM11641_008128 [Rhodosporidiobolus odoratus]
MPYVKLPQEDVEVYYEFLHDVFDPRQPTLLIVPPPYSDTSLVTQRILQTPSQQITGFNRLTLDLRASVPRLFKPFPILILIQADARYGGNALNIGAVHLLTTSITGAGIGFTFATLFPDNLLTLSVGGVAPLYTLSPNGPAFTELFMSWMQGDDPDLLFDALDETMWWLYGDNQDADILDWVSGAILRASPFLPGLVMSELADAELIAAPSSLTVEDVQRIRCPVMIIAGGEDATCSVDVAEDIHANLTSSKDAQLHVIDDAPSMLVYTHAEEVGSLVASFISPHASPPAASSSPSFSFSSALSNLASISPSTSREEILSLDPLDSRSYSRADKTGPFAEARENAWLYCSAIQQGAFSTYACGQKECWEVGERLDDERTGWRFSERNKNDSSPRAKLDLSALWQTLPDDLTGIQASTTTTVETRSFTTTTTNGHLNGHGDYPSFESPPLTANGRISRGPSPSPSPNGHGNDNGGAGGPSSKSSFGSLRESSFLRKAREAREEKQQLEREEQEE